MKYLLLTISLIFASFLSRAQEVDTVCVGESNVRYTVPYINGGHQFRWIIEGGSINTGQNTNSITVNWGFTEGRFPIKLVETSAKGCMGDTSVAYVRVMSSGFVAGGTAPQYVCFNNTASLKANTAASYLWSNGSTNQSTQYLIIKDTTVSVTQMSNCDTVISYFPIKAIIPQANFIASSNNVLKGENVIFNNSSSSNSSLYEWNFNNHPEFNTTNKNTQATFTTIGNENVKLVVATVEGCKDSIIKIITVFENAVEIQIPNAFTPNASNGFQRFVVNIPDNYKSPVFYIYNRWGNLIFKSTERTIEWKGEYGIIDNVVNELQSYDIVPEGTYVYYFEALKDGKKVTKTGNVNVLR